MAGLRTDCRGTRNARVVRRQAENGSLSKIVIGN